MEDMSYWKEVWERKGNGDTRSLEELDGYENTTANVKEIARQIVEELDINETDSVLEVACGAGGPGAADRRYPAGHAGWFLVLPGGRCSHRGVRRIAGARQAHGGGAVSGGGDWHGDLVAGGSGHLVLGTGAALGTGAGVGPVCRIGAAHAALACPRGGLACCWRAGAGAGGWCCVGVHTP